MPKYRVPIQLNIEVDFEADNLEDAVSNTELILLDYAKVSFERGNVINVEVTDVENTHDPKEI